MRLNPLIQKAPLQAKAMVPPLRQPLLEPLPLRESDLPTPSTHVSDGALPARATLSIRKIL